MVHVAILSPVAIRGRIRIGCAVGLLERRVDEMNSVTIRQRLAEWNELAAKRQARRTQLQWQKRNARRKQGLTTLGQPYKKLKWKHKVL